MILGGDLHCFLNAPPLFRFYCLVSNDGFFLHPMEEEGENRECCCIPDFQEFVCHWVSVHAMGSSGGISSCNGARLSGRTTNELASDWSARLVSDRIRTVSCWGLCVLVLLAANIEHGA